MAPFLWKKASAVGSPLGGGGDWALLVPEHLMELVRSASRLERHNAGLLTLQDRWLFIQESKEGLALLFIF